MATDYSSALRTVPSLTDDPSAAELIEFYPSFGRLRRNERDWQIRIRGRVCTPRPDNIRRRLLLRLVSRMLNVSPEQLKTDLFQERSWGFLMIPRKGRQIHVKLLDHHFVLSRKSRRGGHVAGTIRIPRDVVEEAGFHSDAGHVWIPFSGRSTWSGQQRFFGEAQLLSARGVSVISDIDDTIKLTEVFDRSRLLSNTFLRPFASIPGMSEVYQSWEQQGASFHYVSASPWQLYWPLARFCDEFGFPRGSFHLRSIRFRDPSFLKLLMNSKRGKLGSIRWLIRSFPFRKYVLIGDAGENDLEIYGAIARQFPAHVEQICIRILPGQRIAKSRVRKALRGLPNDLWRLFSEAEELHSLKFPEPAVWAPASS